MKTEEIEYNGQIFSCQKIIDISSMIELLSLLAKRQQYLEDKLNFQEERINDKDKRIAELEIMIKGVSQSKEEKFPSVIETTTPKKVIKNDSDDDLYAFLNKDNKIEEKSKDYDFKEIKEEKFEEKPVEKIEEKPGEKIEQKQVEKVVEKEIEKSEEKEEEKPEEKKEIKNLENNNDVKDNIIKEEIENKIDMNFEHNQSPTILKKQNLAQTENKQISNSDNQEKADSYQNNINIDTNLQNPTQTQTQNQAQAPVQNSFDDEILKKIIKRIKNLETKIDQFQQNEVTARSQALATEKANKNRLDTRINLLNKQIEQLEGEQKNMKDEMSKIKVKAEDFNVYDLLKNNTGDGNIDIAKGLVMNLENKVFKKFGFYDLKFKKNEEDIYQNKNDIKNLNNTLNGIKDMINKNTKDINDLKDKNEDKLVEINNFMSEINNKIKDIDTKIESNPPINTNNDIDSNNNIIFSNNNTNLTTNRNNKSNFNSGNNNIISNTNTNDNNNPIINNNNEINLDNNNRQIMEKIRQLETKFAKLNENMEQCKTNEENQKEKVQEQVKVIKEINTRTKELEKNMKIILTQLNIKEVNERLDALEKDLMKKANKYEISELKEKLMTLEENEKDLNFKVDQMQQFSEKIRGDMQQFIKKIEYLTGQLNRLTSENADNEKGKGSILDITKLVDLNLFNEKQKEINKKFDKIRLSFEEFARNMDDILLKLSHVPSDKDFSQFQSIIKTMIEELKLSLSKKYAEKTETNKSIKFLETQIKSIQESFQKKIDGADNWLLAKKPLNNYICASCESIIKGDLDKKSDFVPWNKYPNREEKSYRYGHGFSRMLQLINEERKKEPKEKDSMSDGGSDSEPNVKLPKLKKHHINSGKLKINNIMSDDENNIPYDKNDRYNNDLEPLLTEERPKIMKIFKKNKNIAQSSYLNRNDKVKDKENLVNLIIKTSPNNKEGNQIVQNENNED